MKLDDLNKWMTLIANIGVVLGIFFLAYETRRNSDILETEAYRSASNNLLDLHLESMTSDHMPSLLRLVDQSIDPETNLIDISNFEGDDLRRLHSYLMWRRNWVGDLYIQYSAGLIDEDFWQQNVVPTIRNWARIWEQLGLLPVGQVGFRQAIDTVLEELNEAGT